MEFELTTARLRLRPLRRGDAPRVQALCNNWNVVSMLSRVPYPNPLDVVEAWTGAQASAWEKGSAYNFAIENKEGKTQGEVVGVVGIARRDDGNPGGGYEIGYWLGEPWWGQGLMTEAVARAVEFARSELELEKLHSDYFADNPASGRMQEKCGFRITGRGRLNSLSRRCKVDAVFTEIELIYADRGTDGGRGAGENTDGAAS